MYLSSRACSTSAFGRSCMPLRRSSPARELASLAMCSALTRVGRVPGSRDNRHRSVAWPFVSAPVVHADGFSTAVFLLGDLRSRPECLAAGRTPPLLHACFSARLNRTKYLPGDYDFSGMRRMKTALSSSRQQHPPPLRVKDESRASRTQIRTAHESIQRVNSAEHTWVNSRERQGFSLCPAD
jgi:hypothetical protein